MLLLMKSTGVILGPLSHFFLSTLNPLNYFHLKDNDVVSATVVNVLQLVMGTRRMASLITHRS